MGPQIAKLIGLALVASLVLGAADAEAEKKRRRGKRPRLEAAVVRVLDTAGDPVEGAAVTLEVERADGSVDRRLGKTDPEGEAAFPDVRADCAQLRASVEVGGQVVEGKPRDCAKGLEAFVVVPLAEPAAAPAPAPAVDEDDPYPVAAPSAVEDDPYDEPIPEPPAAAAPAEPPTEQLPRNPRDEPLEARLRLGVDICAAWFYEPGELQRDCDTTDPVGFTFGADFGFHFEPWFMVALEVGYRYFGSEVDFSSFLEAETDTTETDSTEADPFDSSEIDTSITGTSDGTGDTGPAQLVDARNHLLTIGLQLRGTWMLERWVLAVDAVPLGVFHQIFKSDEGQTDINEFYVKVGLSAAYRVGRSSWVGLYLELFQPMPWVHSALFQPGIVSIGLAIGNRFGPGRDDDRPGKHADSDGSTEAMREATQRRREGF